MLFGFQIAMGQGQMEIALDLLKKCSINGDWLCLKNVHLVVSWLPVLEKELNLLKPNEKFRLWMTTEQHNNFPTILLQCSLKITYEVIETLSSRSQFLLQMVYNSS